MEINLFLDNKLELTGTVMESLGRGFKSVRTLGRDALHNIEEYFTVPCVYWTRTTKSNRFINLKEGTRIKITGRLDYDEKFGIIVVVENFEKIEVNI